MAVILSLLVPAASFELALVRGLSPGLYQLGYAGVPAVRFELTLPSV